MVSIAGDYRTGKSFVLSKAFNQPNVFPLGHTMRPETVGIWLWIVPEKYKVRFFFFNYFNFSTTALPKIFDLSDLIN